eukprot:NODE_249_length_1086_cov_461.141814_g242_i0.p1 GENE.NODE_249_length_1086_cov_461.141814_g242_i0~~NODE_249_length_1086_cov_461.141814_g242_i0.p1  ORF type:complete len:274 (-),score=102.85 NODE_249_length_1086_cov_461.141814_g242_i0:184-1005(-)
MQAGGYPPMGGMAPPGGMMGPDTTVWIFEAEPGKWAPFAPEDSQLIEAEFQKGQPQAQLQLRQIAYLLDFQAMSRKNVQSGSERKMQRTTLGQLNNISMLPPPGGPGGAPPPPIEGVCWLFKDEQGGFVRVSPEDSDAIEALYKQGQPVGQVELRGVKYEMNFTTWMRKNLGSGSERGIRRVDPKSLPPFLPAEEGVLWVLQDDAGNWVPYAPPDGAIIEEAFSKGQSPVTLSLLNGQATYEMDFGAMTTKNANTGSSRIMRRLENGKVVPAV